MRLETYLDAMCRAACRAGMEISLQNDSYPHAERQYRKFRDRIIQKDVKSWWLGYQEGAKDAPSSR